MLADDRPGPVSDRSSTSPAAPRGVDPRRQSASFALGALHIELSASPGAARLVVSDEGSRDIYVVDPAALGAWSEMAAKLLKLEPARRAADRVEFRTPFLVDREGRASIAIEGLVSEHGVSYRLLVSGAAGRIAGLMTSKELVTGVAEAAAGAVVVARAPT